MKNIHYLKKTIGFAFLLVSMTFTVAGCGSDSTPTPTPEVQSQNAMKEAFDYLRATKDQNANEQSNLDNFNKALAKCISSNEIFANQEALLTKAYIEIGLNKTSDAHTTLDTIDAQYPNKTEDEQARALLISKENGNPTEILRYLKLSLNDSYSGLDEGLWWGMVEQLPGFIYFRTTPEYTELQKLKPVSPVAKTVSSENVCKDNVTKYRPRWFGNQINLEHSVVEILDTSSAAGSMALEAFFLSLHAVFPPPVPSLLALSIGATGFIYGLVDQGCGIILSDTWITPPLLFIPTSQK